jgi:hypothetical protein
VAKHTPTPWKVDSVDESFVSYSNDGYEEELAEFFNVDEGDGFKSLGGAIANAEFTVRAVNAHDKLVEALSFYIAVCGNTGYALDQQSAEEAYDLAQAALALARGEAVRP